MPDFPLLQLVEMYLARRLKITRGAAENVRRVARQMESFSGRTLNSSDLQEDLACAWLSSLQLSPETINTKRRRLLGLWRFGAHRGLACDPPDDLPRALPEEPIPEAWNFQEVTQLFQAASEWPGYVGRHRAGVWWPGCLHGLYWSSQRVSDLLRCDPKDFDPIAAWLQFRKKKNKRAKLVRLPAVAVDAIRRIYDPTAERLFVWPFSRDHWFRQLRRIAAYAGLDSPRGHCQLSYRLKRCTLSLLWCESPELAQRQADDRDRSTTLRYIDPRIAVERSAADVLPIPKVVDSRQRLRF
jgi:integrase